MGIESGFYMGYGFVVPVNRIPEFFKMDEEDCYNGDDEYTHVVEPNNNLYIYGKMFVSTEAMTYFWNGNDDIVDMKETLKIHYKQKRKIDAMAENCGTEATFFAVGAIY